jgi:hypothetical protein
MTEAGERHRAGSRGAAPGKAVLAPERVDRAALITGANKGLGYETARAKKGPMTPLSSTRALNLAADRDQTAPENTCRAH